MFKRVIYIYFCEIYIHKLLFLCYIQIVDTSKLIAVGLTEQQANTYALLIEKGVISPPDAAIKLNLTRSNTYKILDRLVDMGIAVKTEKRKKFVYYPANPLTISNLVVEQRNIAAKQEEAFNEILGELLAKYHAQTEQPSVKLVSGRTSVANAYRSQISLQQDIYFIRSRADLPVMGFETMHEIRTMPTRNKNKRFGITPDLKDGTTLIKEGDIKSSLQRTWVKQEDYDAPVEWSVSGSTLLIILFGAEPHAITIDNPLIADAFRQIWHLLNVCLQSMPHYKDLPR